MQNYHKLTVWKKAHALALEVYRVTGEIPRRSNTELIDQLRRCSLSVPANIVEGSASATNKEFARFLRISFSSANELEYHLRFAADSDIIPQAVFSGLQAQIIEVRKMLMGLIKRASGEKKDLQNV